MAAKMDSAMDAQYNRWGFKLNMMYASIPPRYYRNLHNFNEFNAPRIDVGMLTAARYEQATYGQRPDPVLTVADRFYTARRDEVAALVKEALLGAGAISSASEIEFQDGFPFVPPTARVGAGSYSPDKLYALFVIYWHADDEGTEPGSGIPFLRVVVASLAEAEAATYNWDYREIRIGRGEKQHQYKPFVAPPMFIAYFPETYTDLGFSYFDPAHDPVYERHSSYFKVEASAKTPYEDFINRETIGEPNEYGEFVISWDGEPARRSIVASQPYYDWDDDLQSAHVEAQLDARIDRLGDAVSRIEEKLARLSNDMAGSRQRD